MSLIHHMLRDLEQIRDGVTPLALEPTPSLEVAGGGGVAEIASADSRESSDRRLPRLLELSPRKLSWWLAGGTVLALAGGIWVWTGQLNGRPLHLAPPATFQGIEAARSAPANVGPLAQPQSAGLLTRQEPLAPDAGVEGRFLDRAQASAPPGTAPMGRGAGTAVNRGGEHFTVTSQEISRSGIPDAENMAVVTSYRQARARGLDTPRQTLAKRVGPEAESVSGGDWPAQTPPQTSQASRGAPREPMQVPMVGEGAALSVQAGLFETLEAARAARLALPFGADQARIETVRDMRNQPLYSLRVGRYFELAPAETMRDRLVRYGLESTITRIRREQPLVQMNGRIGRPNALVLPAIAALDSGAASLGGDPEPSWEGALAVAGGEQPVNAFFVYVVQVGSFQTASLAERMVETFRVRGYNPFVLKLRGEDNRLWHSVCFGLFTEIEQAKEAVRRFRAEESQDALVLPVESGSFFTFLSRESAPSVEGGGAGSRSSAPSMPDSYPRQARHTPAASVPPPPAPTGQMTDAMEAPQVEGALFAIQVGAYLEREGAREMVEKLARRGHEAYIRVLPSRVDSGRIWNTVRVGHFRDLDRADLALAAFRRQSGQDDAYVVRYDSFGGPERHGETGISESPSVSSPAERSAPPAPRIEVTEQTPMSVTVDELVTELAPPAPSGTRSSGASPETSFAATRPARQVETPTFRPPTPLTATTAPAEGMPFLHRPQPVGDAFVTGQSGVSAAAVQAQKFLQEAERLKASGDLEGAESHARQSLKLQPENPRVREFLGRILFESGRANEAYPLLSEGLNHGFDPGLVKLMARILIQDGKLESALSVLENAQAQGSGDDPEMKALLAALYQRNNNHWKAIELYQALLENNGQNSVWWMGLGISLESVQERESAREAYQNALKVGQLALNLQQFVNQRIQALAN